MKQRKPKPSPHLGGFTLLPPKPGVCQECAVDHPPEMPHNQQSLFYQYAFFGVHGRSPTWTDAMAHCDDKMKDNWMQKIIEYTQQNQQRKP